jgi:ABC-type antimicrobial peptide transport system permease subunit
MSARVHLWVGIFLSVAGVLAMARFMALTAIAQGSNAAVEKTIRSMGASNLLVMPGTATNGGNSFATSSANALTPQDADAIARECPAVHCVAPAVRVRTQINHDGKNWVPLYIYGTTISFLDVREWTDLAEGEPFTDADVRDGARVCLIGQTIKRELFDDESPLGKELRLQNVSFRVVGVLGSRGANMMGLDQDDIVLAPWTSIQARVSTALSDVNQTNPSVSTAPTINSQQPLDPGNQELYPHPVRERPRAGGIDQILVRANSTEEIPLAAQQITELLHVRHHIKRDQPDDFSIRDMTEMASALSSTTAAMTQSLLFAALVPLIPGGIGIMNILLGLRRETTTRPQNTFGRYLFCAMMLGLLGGLLGMLIGWLAALLFGYYLHWPIEMSPGTIVTTLAVSAGVGALFGLYPAWSAHRCTQY